MVLYHATNQNPDQVAYQALEAWLAEQFAANRPWDEVATDLITATGRNDENGAVNFALAYEAKPVEIAGEVSRIFLGVQIQCAQCHDHQTDPWKREQFHEFASFFAGSRSRRVEQGRQGGAAGLRGRRAGQGAVHHARPEGPAEADPGEPAFFLAEEAEPVPAGLTVEEKRDLVASYVTGQDNPWFAKAFVNRIWDVLIGEGFYNPIDDLGPGRRSNPPRCSRRWPRSGSRGATTSSGSSARSSTPRPTSARHRATNSAAEWTPFAANCPSRLRSDQILEALSQALDVSFDGPANPRRTNKKVVKVSKADATEAKAAKPVATKGYQRRSPRGPVQHVFGFDPSLPNEEVLGTIPQALFLMNSPQIDRAIRAGRGTMLGELLESHPDNRAALETLYLRVLARRPNAKEVKTCGDYLAEVGDRREAFEDILWGLINSTEFISRR